MKLTNNNCYNIIFKIFLDYRTMNTWQQNMQNISIAIWVLSAVQNGNLSMLRMLADYKLDSTFLYNCYISYQIWIYDCRKLTRWLIFNSYERSIHFIIRRLYIPIRTIYYYKINRFTPLKNHYTFHQHDSVYYFNEHSLIFSLVYWNSYDF